MESVVSRCKSVGKESLQKEVSGRREWAVEGFLLVKSYTVLLEVDNSNGYEEGKWKECSIEIERYIYICIENVKNLFTLLHALPNTPITVAGRAYHRQFIILPVKIDKARPKKTQRLL